MVQGYVSAYVLMNAGATNIEGIRTRLLDVSGVVLAHGLLGPTDLICYIEAESLPDLQSLLDEEVRGLIEEGLITNTETRLVLTSRGEGFTRVHNRPAKGSAWVFVDASVGDPQPVADELMKINGVVNAHTVLGRCDIVVFIETEDLEELMKTLDEDLRRIPGIVKTDTRLVLMRRATSEKSRQSRDREDLHIP